MLFRSRAGLPDPAAHRLAPTPGSEGPRNPAETALAGLAAGLLKVERVGVHDDFFELGFDSILAIQLAARARQAGLWVTPAQLFQFPTVAGLAAVAAEAPPPPPAAAPGPVAPAAGAVAREPEVEGAYPLTPLQTGMLLHARFSPGDGAYVQQLDCAVRGVPDRPALERAWG